MRSTVKWPRMWGRGEEKYPEKQQLISTFTKNLLLGNVGTYHSILCDRKTKSDPLVGGDLIKFGTGSYKLDTGEKDETYFVKDANIRNDTLWDYNSYSAFSATYKCHGMPYLSWLP